ASLSVPQRDEGAQGVGVSTASHAFDTNGNRGRRPRRDNQRRRQPTGVKRDRCTGGVAGFDREPAGGRRGGLEATQRTTGGLNDVPSIGGRVPLCPAEVRVAVAGAVEREARVPREAGNAPGANAGRKQRAAE